MEQNIFLIYYFLAAALILLILFFVLWILRKQQATKGQLQLVESEENLKEKSESYQKLALKLAVVEEKLVQFEAKDLDYQQLQQQLITSKTENTELQIRWQEQGKNANEKIKLLQDAEIQLKTQFENLATKIFEDRSKQLSEQNKVSMEHIVSPIKEQLIDFKKRVDTVYDNETKDRISLREEIVSLRRDTEKMNKEALTLPTR
jgi:DNA recombination protein RmuC